MRIKNVLQVSDDEIEDVSLGLLISNVNRFYSNYLEKSLAKYGLTRSQTHFLLGLNQKDHVSQEEICRLFNMTEGTVARTMKRLEDKKLITRETNPEDKRKKVVILTEKGRQQVEEISSIDENLEKDFSLEFSKENLVELKILLKKLAETINRE